VDRWCHVVSVMYPYSRILRFLYRSRYFSFQIAPQLYSRGWVNPFPNPLLLRKSDSAGNGTRTSGSVARNSDQWTKAYKLSIVRYAFVCTPSSLWTMEILCINLCINVFVTLAAKRHLEYHWKCLFESPCSASNWMWKLGMGRYSETCLKNQRKQKNTFKFWWN
jgi:hypothetical protein